jgi:GDPmannose 4,6-dehydratase
MLQQDHAEDYVLATGETHSVEEFCAVAFDRVGLPLSFEGEGIDRVGRDPAGVARVRVDARYFRPAEVDLLVGDPGKAKAKLGWEAKTTFKALVGRMVDHDLELARRDAAATETVTGG